MLPTGSLTISPSVLDVRGSNVILTWSSPYATSSTLDNGIGAVTNPTTGSITKFVLLPTTFQITFTNANGSYIATASITANPDIEYTNTDLSISSQVYREQGAGLVTVNRVRLTGDGYPSYQIRSKYVPPADENATIIWALTYTGDSRFQQPAKLTAIDVSVKNAPFIVSDTVIYDMDNLYWPIPCAGGAVWPRPKQLFVDANYIYYWSAVSGSIIVRANNTSNPYQVSTFAEATVPSCLIKYGTNKIVATAIYAADNVGIHVYDISNPLSLSRTTSAAGVWTGRTIYVSSTKESAISSSGEFITPVHAGMVKLSTFNPTFGAWSFHNLAGTTGTWFQDQKSVATKGNYMYLFQVETGAPDKYYIQIIDLVSNTEVLPGGSRLYFSATEYANNVGTCQQLWIKGNYLIFFNEASTTVTEPGIFVWDISTLTNPVRVAQYRLDTLTSSVSFVSKNYVATMDNKYLYILYSNESAVFTFRRYIAVIDASDWTNLILVNGSVLDANDWPAFSNPSMSAIGCYPCGINESGNHIVP